MTQQIEISHDTAIRIDENGTLFLVDMTDAHVDADTGTYSYMETPVDADFAAPAMNAASPGLARQVLIPAARDIETARAGSLVGFRAALNTLHAVTEIIAKEQGR
ncbi:MULTISPECIES: hypothetical protein [unclassified Nocardioides]|uniref:hypothetical protein n=1 Tax=unclassified Nocardioides TaxID=2615069 RepID=UPI0030149418